MLKKDYFYNEPEGEMEEIPKASDDENKDDPPIGTPDVD